MKTAIACLVGITLGLMPIVMAHVVHQQSVASPTLIATINAKKITANMSDMKREARLTHLHIQDATCRAIDIETDTVWESSWTSNTPNNCRTILWMNGTEIIDFP